MARPCNHALRLLPNNPVTAPLPGSRSRGVRCRNLAVHAQLPCEDDAYPTEPLKKVQVTQSVRRSRRRGTGGARQSLVSVGTARGGGDQWSSDFDLTMRQLRLDDLIEDGQRDADVLVHLLVQQVIALAYGVSALSLLKPAVSASEEHDGTMGGWEIEPDMQMRS
ncbi:hypothetical protein BAE44_0014350 [Dichanthelium oligosanthes]|uniref:Uncharacterized protein n=1 Tax=Dichanthelium oligosanthes TaxID=888268 RepID=A0A1E5VHP2_9POAL|nr:hypothetical protein BAE44_0014350 [Dichanthelium oligosanthes]